MSNLIYKFERRSYSQLLRNLLLKHFGKFQASSSSIYEKVDSQFFLKTNFANNMRVFLQVKHYVHEKFFFFRYCLSCSTFFVHVQSSKFLLHETAWKKKKNVTINLINTWLILISSLLRYFTPLIWKIKHGSPDSIQKYFDELIC